MSTKQPLASEAHFKCCTNSMLSTSLSLLLFLIMHCISMNYSLFYFACLLLDVSSGMIDGIRKKAQENDRQRNSFHEREIIFTTRTDPL